MVLGRGYAKWRAVLFCTKSYYLLVDGTSPIPLNKLNAWPHNSYKSLYFAVGYFFKNEKRWEPISLKLTDSPLELSSDIVFSDTFLLLLFITFKELVDIIFCSLNLLHIFLNLTIFTVQLFLFCKDLGILCTEIFYLRKLLQMKLIKGILGSLMKQDFLSVLFQELLAISAFTIFRIYVFCLKVIKDMFLQDLNLSKSLLFFFDGS